MEPASILRARIRAAQADLQRASDLLEQAAVHKRLYERVRPDFAIRLTASQESLTADLNNIGKQTLAENWKSFEINTGKLTRLLQECQDLLLGALCRSKGLDGGMCELADSLIEELSRKARVAWSSFTILGDGDRYVDLARIVRLQFPVSSIWNLPVAAHEFGHFLAQELKSKRPGGTAELTFQTFLKDRDALLPSPKWSLLNEYFADACGTYTLGPAFACNCLLLRFRPGGGKAFSSHPPDALRARLILQILEQVRAHTKDAYGGVLKTLQTAWPESLQEAGQPEPAGQERDDVDKLAVELYKMLQEGAPEAEYKSWDTALGLDFSADPPEKGWKKKAGIADVLNGAWRARLEGGVGTDPAKLNTVGRMFCEFAAKAAEG